MTPLAENVNSPLDCSNCYMPPIALVEDSQLPPADTTTTLIRTTPVWTFLPKGGRRYYYNLFPKTLWLTIIFYLQDLHQTSGTVWAIHIRSTDGAIIWRCTK